MRTAPSISEQIQRRSFIVVDCSIPAALTIAEWRRRRVVRPIRRPWFRV